MSKIAIVTDSTCDIAKEQIEKYGIKLLPLKIVYQDRQYIDRVEIQPEEVYENFEREIPKTSMPSPGEAISLFEKLAQEGFTDVICIHISSGLSGTYQMVKSVARQMKDIINIEVIDSKALSMGMGFLVLEAKKLVQSGMDFDEVVERVRKLQKKIKVFFVVKTLEYLRKGGRIGYVAGTIGEMLNVKPIISINEEGKYYTYDKVRGRKRSLNKIVEIVKEYAKGKKLKFAVMHGGALEEAKSVLDKLQLPNLDLAAFGQIGPSMIVHTGPGLIGVVFYEDDE
ncbi:DegV family protein with EDD domain [Desulfohalotomaculum tongense]|uniref:DegV family protein n=1 Tax=Desulforadius tongensis TaxID=1216062 RepID=UPI001957A71C|nr:DegV family protein [Desulforadius tongensis]MBM7855675.1 DegV family protein with EDD domain [Desulforadius tongensis]